MNIFKKKPAKPVQDPTARLISMTNSMLAAAK